MTSEPTETTKTTADDPETTETIPATTTTVRRRAMLGLFTAVATMSTSMAGTSTVGTLIAADAVGEGWSGIASASGITGTAIGAITTSRIMAKHGRRTGLLTGFAVATVAAVIAATAAATETFPLVLVGMIGIGIGNSGAQLARYAAADLYDQSRRGSALGVIVWAGTVGAVLGPTLIGPTARAAETLGLPELSGAFLLAVALTACAAGASLLLPKLPRLAKLPSLPKRSPQPRATEVTEATEATKSAEAIEATEAAESASYKTSALLRNPVVRLALAAMIAGQVSMVAVMTMTPVHLHQHDQGLDVVGIVLSAHMIGMFALAPISGRLTDRFGGAVVITGGVGTLVVSTVLAAVAPMSLVALSVALFLLGYGWNLCFVGGSSLLSRNLPAGQRTRLQGTVDGLVWGAAAVASLASGRILELGDYSFVAAVAGLVAIVPVVFLVGRKATI